jgi:anti-sigma factor RsiW
MNRRMEDNLEAFLSGSLDAAGRADFSQQLAESDNDTRQIIAAMEKQSRMIRAALRPRDEAEPGAGFYARVMDRIEAQRTSSPFWAAFLEPLFFKRLVMASATLMLLLGITLFTGGPDDTAIAADSQQAPHIIMAGEPEPLLTVTPVSEGAAASQGRDVVLGDLTTYQE